MSCSSCCILHKCDNDLCAGVVSQSQVSSPVSVSIFSSVSISGCGCFSGSDSVSGYSLGPHPLLLGKYGHLNNCAAQAASVPSLSLPSSPLSLPSAYANKQANKASRRAAHKDKHVKQEQEEQCAIFLALCFLPLHLPSTNTHTCSKLYCTCTHSAVLLATLRRDSVSSSHLLGISREVP